MQASKLVIDNVIYALQHPEKGLVRFKVKKIVTTRTNNGVGAPSQVWGWIMEPLTDIAAETGLGVFKHSDIVGPFDPDLIKGDFREHADLVARKHLEDEARAVAATARNNKRLAVRDRLIALGVLATASYSSVTIEDHALDALDEVLDRVRMEGT